MLPCVPDGQKDEAFNRLQDFYIFDMLFVLYHPKQLLP
jgi:hypothetical protein